MCTGKAELTPIVAFLVAEVFEQVGALDHQNSITYLR